MRRKKTPWIVNSGIGPIAIGPPCPGLPTTTFAQSDREARTDNLMMWTGSRYESWATIQERGYRYNPSEQL